MADTNEYWRVIFILNRSDAIPHVNMCVTSIGTSVTDNNGVEFTLGSRKFKSEEFNENRPFADGDYDPLANGRMLVHRGDEFKIDSASSWPIYIHAVMHPASWVPAAIKTGKLERWMEVEKIVDEVTS